MGKKGLETMTSDCMIKLRTRRPKKHVKRNLNDGYKPHGSCWSQAVKDWH